MLLLWTQQMVKLKYSVYRLDWILKHSWLVGPRIASLSRVEYKSATSCHQSHWMSTLSCCWGQISAHTLQVIIFKNHQLEIWFHIFCLTPQLRPLQVKAITSTVIVNNIYGLFTLFVLWYIYRIVIISFFCIEHSHSQCNTAACRSNWVQQLSRTVKIHWKYIYLERYVGN